MIYQCKNFSPKKVLLCLSTSLVLLLNACAQKSIIDEAVTENQEIYVAQQQVKENPGDVTAIRNLGILYYKAGEYPKALKLLTKANQIGPQNGRTLCYLGLTFESLNKNEKALAIYSRDVQPTMDFPLGKWLEGRKIYLLREQKKSQALQQLQRNGGKDNFDIDKNKVLITPFNFHGADSKYSFLGRGMIEWISHNLRQVPQIHLVDQLQIRTVTSELQKRMAMLQTEQNFVRLLGKIFNAKIVLSGGFNVLDGKQIVFDVTYWDVTSDEIPHSHTYSKEITGLSVLKNELVNGILKQAGVQVADRNREQIMSKRSPELPAFISFSAGVSKEDSGDYREALLFYEKALEIDPAIPACKSKIEIMKKLLISQQDPERIL